MRALDHDALTLGEGPRWDDRADRLLLVDILGGRILHGDPTRTLEVTAVADTVGAVAPLANGRDHVLGAVGAEAGIVDLRDGTYEALADLEPDRPGQLRANDGACDRDGRFVVGTMERDAEPGAGRLLRIHGDGRSEVLADGCTIPNGLAWSDDGTTMFHVDSGPGTITAYPYGDGPLGAGRIIYRHDGPGTPDGMCRATDGTLWVAVWGGARVLQLSSEGEVVGTLAVPSTQPTACCFAGAERQLIVTSAAVGIDTPSDADGRTFAFDVDAAGEPATPFDA